MSDYININKLIEHFFARRTASFVFQFGAARRLKLIVVEFHDMTEEGINKNIKPCKY